MKRRALSLALALVLLLGMVPLTAFAAEDHSISDECISLIKFFEGFHKYPYYDYGQYSVGYGSTCSGADLERYRKYGITEEEATELLLEQVAEFEDAVDAFDAKYGLNLTQTQYDALVSFTYNVGAAWTRDTSHLLTRYVIDGKTGNDFLFAFVRWCTAGGELSDGLIKRRLVEANLYLNGEYSTVVPADLGYVTFAYTSAEYDGESMSVRIQGYDAAATDVVRPVAVRSGYRFLGWYTASTGGKWISHLDASTSGMQLYAHWQSGEGNVSGGVIQGTSASYERVAAGELKVYAEPSTDSAVQYTLDDDAVISIVADYVDANGVKWGKLTDGNWVELGSTDPQLTPSDDSSDNNESGSQDDEVIATGTVTLNSGRLNIRSGAGTGYSIVGSLTAGTRVEFYEFTTVSGTQWGRISKGWISMDYVTLDAVEEEPPVEETTEAPTTEPTEAPTTEPTEAPTTEPTEAPTTEPTEAPTTEPTEAPATEPTEAPTEAPTAPPAEEETDKVVATGTVNVTSGSLNVRKGAGTGYAKVTSLKKGTKVEIYEIVTVSGTQWGRISSGWISLTYVKLDATSSNQTQVRTGTVNTKSGSLNVRSGPGTGYSVVSSLKKGAAVKIYETKTVGSVTWGRVDKGWVSMQYIKLTESGTGSNTGTGSGSGSSTGSGSGSNTGSSGSGSQNETVTAASRTGTVTASGTLNVRKGAGTGYSKVGTVKRGDKVTITDMKMVSGSAWGKISSGWICLDYVKLNAATAGSPALIKGSNLNIRSGAGTSYSKVGTYSKGTLVTILETKKVGSTTWGKTAKGWISMDYVI